MAGGGLPLLLATLLGAVPAAPGAAVARPVPRAPAASETSARLAVLEALRSQRDPATAAPEVLCAALVERGVHEEASLVPFLLDVLRDRQVPGNQETAPQVLSEVQRELVLGLLTAAGPDAVLPHVDGRISADTSLQGREAAAWVLGRLGRADRVRTLVGLALTEGEERVPARLEEPWIRSLGALLARDDAAFAQIEWRDLDPALLTPLLRAVGQSRNPRGVELLAGVLPWKPELATLALSQVRLLGPSLDGDLNEAVCDILRTYLDADRPLTCQAAAQALGEMLDDGSIPELLDLLEEEHEGVRSSAHWALRAVSGAAYPDDVRLWRDWYRLELDWRLRERPALLRDLAGADAHRAVRALKKLALHPWNRHELAPDVALVLRRDEPELRREAAALLGELRSPQGLHALVDALEDPDEGVAEAAWGALCSLSGRELPRDARDVLENLDDYL